MQALPRAPNVPLLRALWSLLDGIWGVLKGSWGVLVYARVTTWQLSEAPMNQKGSLTKDLSQSLPRFLHGSAPPFRLKEPVRCVRFQGKDHVNIGSCW